MQLCHESAPMAWAHLNHAIGPLKSLHHIGVCQVLTQREFHQGLHVLSLVWGHRGLNNLRTQESRGWQRRFERGGQLARQSALPQSHSEQTPNQKPMCSP